MKGYDFDGVWSIGFCGQPGEKSVVISGSLWNDWERVSAGVGPKTPIYLRPFGRYGDREAGGQWKGLMCQLLKITDFYEDDPLQAGIVKRMNPETNVYLVKPGSTIWRWQLTPVLAGFVAEGS